MNIGQLRHKVTLDNPTGTVPDGEGGFTEGLVRLATRIPASVTPATVRSLERVVANTVTSTASHIVHLRYVAGVTTNTICTFHDRVDRTLRVTGFNDPEERHIELFLECQEVLA